MLVLRAIFIFAGTALIEEFWWMLLVFGVVLLFSGSRCCATRRTRANTVTTAR